MNKEELKSLAETAKDLADPIDLEALVRDGVLEQKGKSYYIKNLEAMPKSASSKINTMTHTKNGLKVTFYKERISARK
jgi:hypothetical protein